ARSSGQSAMPRWAIRLDGKRIVSVPSSCTDPSRRPTMPMIDFMVVVFPAPLRPSRVTTSPTATSNCTPCRMCDSPYHALRSRTESKGLTEADSGMPGPEIGLHHVGILRHRGVVALRQDLAAREHRDMVR